MHHIRRVAGALALLAGVSQSARAQEPTFHAGQWGAEAGIGESNAATLLRFSSSSNAWMLNFSGAWESLDVDAPNLVNPGNNTIWNTSLRLGFRTYSSGAASVRPFHSFGAFGSYAHAHNGGGSLTNWATGGFFELGGSWLLNSHVGLGGSGELDVGYTNQKTEIDFAGEKQTAKGWFANIGQIRFLASVYF